MSLFTFCGAPFPPSNSWWSYSPVMGLFRWKSETQKAHARTRAGESWGSWSPLWDLRHFRIKCLPCSSPLSDLAPQLQRDAKEDLSGGTPGDTWASWSLQFRKVMQKVSIPIRAHQERDWPTKTQGAILELSPLLHFQHLLEEGKFWGLMVSYKMLFPLLTQFHWHSHAN